MQSGSRAENDAIFNTLFNSSSLTNVDKATSRHVRQKTTDSDSEFGAFVSVTALEDPLMASDFGLSSQGGGPSVPPVTNASLSFFDKFTQDAKAASDQSKQAVLDELLEYQDKPLSWLEGVEGQKQASQPDVHTGDLLDLSDDVPDVPNVDNALVTQPFTSEQPLEDLLDHDFFAPKPPLAHVQPSNMTRPDHSPSRTSTLALPVIPAPPLADTHNVSYTSSPSNDNINDSSPSKHRPSTSSYSTLSNISSRWMSTFLHRSPPAQYSHPKLESVFSDPERPEPTRSQSSDRTPSRPIYRTSSYTNTPRSSVDAQISHGTPFGRSAKSKWEREIVGAQPNAEQLIEKEAVASIDLTGRKASTAPVLEVVLAEMIRSHLPALARLPKKWSLVYSLDQHGISLNTLYERCEAHMQVKPGTTFGPAGLLVVFKDAGDGLFGAWMGKEGVHPSRGKGYYGSGDSFLWKYLDGKLKVFKWTGRNNYVALCEPEFISFGGGDGNYGLYLDNALYEGSSAACPTFANEPLCSSGKKNAGVVSFECVGLEVWGIGP